MGFQKATRTAVKLKIGLQGPSGSGKTLGALMLARSLVGPEGRIAVIDTENETASLYSDRVDFDTLPITAPYLSKKYNDGIALAVAEGYDIVVIDSISHQWAGDGGILARKDLKDKQGGNSWTNWASFTTEHEGFKAAILQSPIDLIATLRSKQEYVAEQNAQGKTAPKKLGMAPIQREGMEYEMSCVFEITMAHDATISKDRTGLFETGVAYDLTKPTIGKLLLDWRRTAKPARAVAPPDLTIRLPGTDKHFGGFGGMRVNEIPRESLADVAEKLLLAGPKYIAELEAVRARLAEPSPVPA